MGSDRVDSVPFLWTGWLESTPTSLLYYVTSKKVTLKGFELIEEPEKLKSRIYRNSIRLPTSRCLHQSRGESIKTVSTRVSDVKLYTPINPGVDVT